MSKQTQLNDFQGLFVYDSIDYDSSEGAWVFDGCELTTQIGEHSSGTKFSTITVNVPAGFIQLEEWGDMDDGSDDYHVVAMYELKLTVGNGVAGIK